MQTFLGYWLIEPLANHYIDRFDSVPDLTYQHHGRACEAIDLAVFLSGNERYLRATVPNYSPDGELVPEKDEEIFNVVNLAETIIRLSFNGEAKFYDQVLVAMYGSDDQHIFEISPNSNQARSAVNCDGFRTGMESAISSPEFSTIYKLYVDANDFNIPLQYRYLSFYKILELTLKSGDRWDYSRLEHCIAISKIEEHSPIGVARSAKNWIHELRDKCAHIKNGHLSGVTGLDTTAVSQLASAMPLINRLACAAMGSLSSKLQTVTAGAHLQYRIQGGFSGRTLVAPRH